MMKTDQRVPRIAWYRSPVDRETLMVLSQRSDWKGLLQTCGYLGVFLLTGAAAWYTAGQGAWLLLLLMLLLHGTCCAFLLNTFFLYVISFLGSLNPIMF
jgi:hypothetical protein